MGDGEGVWMKTCVIPGTTQEVIKTSLVITEFESKVERDLKRFKSNLHGVFSEACEMLGWRDTVIVRTKEFMLR